MSALSDYYWIVVVGGMACFFMAFGIGANDVANQFGTSVGSKAISLKWAVVLSAILEFVGAVAFGGAVSDTVRSKIVDFEAFEDNPGLLMFGMLCALIGAGVWLLVASRFGLPVSTTHSIIGAIIGFAMATGDSNAVQWDEVGLIVASWFASPILSGVAAAALFLLIRFFVLSRPNSTRRAYWLLPVFMFAVFTTFFLYLLFKNKGTLSGVSCWMNGKYDEPCSIKKWSQSNPGAAVGAGLGSALLVSLLLTPILWWYANRFLRDFDEIQTDDQSALEETKASKRNGASEKQTNAKAVTMDSLAIESANPAALHVAPVGEHEHAPETPPASKALPRYNEPDDVALDGILRQIRPSAVSDIPVQSPEKEEDERVNDDIILAMALDDSHGVEQHPGARNSSASQRTVESLKDAKKTGGAWDRIALNHDLHADALAENERAAEIHAQTENFDPRTERFFAMCQILSAMFDCIGHGSNDTANAIGPFAAILGIFEAGKVTSKVETPVWVLAFGGVSIAIGLALYGYHVIKSIGMKLCKITPSRGFSIELGAAWIIIIGSNLGIPLSTTHCQVGATVGVGLTERQNGKMCQCVGGGAVNWRLMFNVFGAWIFTLIFAGLVTAMLFSFGAYAPFVVRGSLPAAI